MNIKKPSLMDKEVIQKTIKNNQWLILASICFLLWNFFLIHTLWHNRYSPPEPDDSYIYITHIESVRRCPSIFFCESPIYSIKKFGFYSHFTYRLMFGYPAILFGLTSEEAYHISFYVGTLMLLLVLIAFLRSLGANDKLSALSLVFLMSHAGGGSSHSFSWVVPQLFSVMVFLLIISLVLGKNKHWKILSIFLVVFAILTHTISIYFFALLGIFVAIYFLLLRKIDKLILRKALLVIFTAALTYSTLSFYLFRVAQGNPYGIENFLGQSINNIKSYIASEDKNQVPKKNQSQVMGAESEKKQLSDSNSSFKKTVFPAWEKIKNNYLKWIFLNPLGLLSFIIVFEVLIFYKQKKILALYIAALSFTLLTSINQYGGRSLAILIPITFLLYSFGFYFLFQLASEYVGNQKYKRLINGLLIASIFLFLLPNFIFSFLWNKYVNERDNYRLERDYVIYIQDNIPDKQKISYRSKILNSFDVLYKLNNIKKTKDAEQAYYYVAIEKERTPYKETSLNKFLDLFSRSLHIKRQEYKETTLIPFSERNNSFQLEREFGDLKIYKNSKFNQ